MGEYWVQLPDGEIICAHMEDCGLWNPGLHTYRAKRSTTSVLIHLREKLGSDAEKKYISGLGFIDMSTAFDTVRCRTLVDKMRVYGFSKHAMDWSSSYMNDRRQRVQIGSALSPPIQVNTGVPQGLILSPLFYNILTNNLLSCLE